MNSPEYHALANLFPLIEGPDFDAFCASLKSDARLHDKIVLLDGKILDGRNRQRACIATGITAHYRTFDPATEGDPLAFVVAKNLHRRHLNESQRAMAAARISKLSQGARTDLSPNGERSQSDRAGIMNVGKRTVERADKVLDHATPNIVRAVDRGVLPVSTAAMLSDLPSDVQDAVLNGDESSISRRAIALIKQRMRSAKERDLADRQVALPDKRFGVIYADPEWRFEVYSRDSGMDRAADNHYPTTATDEICKRPVQKIAAKDCALFLWATVPMLPDALQVMAAWGFTYKSHCIWTKDKVGTGYWFRNAHELLLIGTRGDIPAPAMGTQWPSTIEARVGKHSAKPDRFYELIEEYFPTLPKIELNARRARKGWDAWGLEAPTDAAGNPLQHDDSGEIIETEAERGASASLPPEGDDVGAQPTADGVRLAVEAATEAPAAVHAQGVGAAGAHICVGEEELDIPEFLRRVPGGSVLPVPVASPRETPSVNAEAIE